MQLSLITPPAELPVSVVEAKAHLRIEHDDEDALIERIIGAAVARIDGRYGWLRRALVTQTWELELPWFPVSRRIALALPPLQSVTSVKYRDLDDVEQTFSSDSYQVVKTTDEGYIYLKTGESWPGGTFERPDAVKIQFVAGYGGAAAVPETIRQAILIEIGGLYAERGDAAVKADPSVVSKRLLAPYKRVLIR
jgi:uncharacterized phiE125 gp8 family phage protein